MNTDIFKAWQQHISQSPKGNAQPSLLDWHYIYLCILVLLPGPINIHPSIHQPEFPISHQSQVSQWGNLFIGEGDGLKWSHLLCVVLPSLLHSFHPSIHPSICPSISSFVYSSIHYSPLSSFLPPSLHAFYPSLHPPIHSLRLFSLFITIPVYLEWVSGGEGYWGFMQGGRAGLGTCLQLLPHWLVWGLGRGERSLSVNQA